MSVKNVKHLRQILGDWYKEDDELIITYWTREDIRERFIDCDAVMSDEAWTMFKQILEHYTKNNELSSDLIDEVVSEVMDKLELPSTEDDDEEGSV